MLAHKRAPAFIVGALFFFVCGRAAFSSPELSLPRVLYEEGTWQVCAREAARVLLSTPDDAEAQVFYCASRHRMGLFERSLAISSLSAFYTNSAIPLFARAVAGYELGREYIKNRNVRAAKSVLFRALQAAADDTFLTGVISLSLHKVYLQAGAESVEHITADELAVKWQNTWTAKVRKHVMITHPTSISIYSLPSSAITWLYRTQFRSAIGNRCRMTPSCSEYFRLAGAKHGLLAFPMIADRGVREPSETSSDGNQVWSGQEWRYADPLEDHDFWLNSACECGPWQAP